MVSDALIGLRIPIRVLFVAVVVAWSGLGSFASNPGVQVYTIPAAGSWDARFGFCMNSIESGPHQGIYLIGGTNTTGQGLNEVWAATTPPYLPYTLTTNQPQRGR